MSDYPVELLRFIARFDRREYWLAHEELEELWRVDRQDLYKGLIQLAAAFVHIERANWNGAIRLLRSGVRYLDAYPDRHAGFDLAALRTSGAVIQTRVQELADGALGGLEDAHYLSMSTLFSGAVPPGIVEEVELPYKIKYN